MKLKHYIVSITVFVLIVTSFSSSFAASSIRKNTATIVKTYVSGESVADVEGLVNHLKALINPPAKDAKLTDLTVNGQTVSDFDPATFIYNVEMPIGTTEVPVIGATASNTGAIITITPAESLPGSTKITVTAKSGTENVYIVNLSVEAATYSQYSMTINGPTDLYFNETSNYTIHTLADGTGNSGRIVIYQYAITGGSGVLEVFSSQYQTWIRIPLIGLFGPAEGFELPPNYDFVTPLRFTPTELTNYHVILTMKTTDGVQLYEVITELTVLSK